MKFLITVFAIFTAQLLCAGILDDLSKASKANPEIIMDVVQTKNMSFFNETIQSSMTIFVSASGKMRIQTHKPFEALSIFDGKYFARFEKSSDSWRKLDGSSGLVARCIFDEMRTLLSGSVSGASYDISKKSENTLLLIPKSDFVRKAIKSIEIATRVENGLRVVEKISISDCDGDTTILDVKKITKAIFAPKIFDTDSPL